MINLKEYLVKEVLNGSESNLALRLIKIVIFGSGGQKVILWYRLSKYLYDKKIKNLSIYLLRRLESGYGVYISPNAVIGIGLKFPHPTGIVIGDGVKIGRNCIIYQQVTFGGARLGDANNSCYPQVADNVTFFAGAKVIGKISVKSNCIIGANSVVIKDIPEGCTVVGIPARIIGDK